jgi:6-phosphogluconate dehydrogenase
MKTSPFHLDLHSIAGIWGHGSVVRSWLLELLDAELAEDAELKAIRGWVEDSGEGRWTVQAAIDQNVPAPVITLALQARLRSRQEESFGAKILAALRNQFGGHAVKKT